MRIDPNTVCVWRLRLDAAKDSSAAQIDPLLGLLSAEELRKANAFRTERHRRDYILAHAALRSILGRCLRVSAASLEIVSAVEGGKPALSAAASAGNPLSDLRFNLSHTSGAALIAVALGRELGIDIEFQRPMEDLAAMARSVMSAAELQRWILLGAEEQFSAFYRVWTRKESYLKAIGLGLFRSLQDVTVPVSEELLEGPDNSGTASRVIHDVSGEGVWHVRDVPVWESYSASVCWQVGAPVELRFRDLDRITLAEL